jgi:hypothetical protein
MKQAARRDLLAGFLFDLEDGCDVNPKRRFSPDYTELYDRRETLHSHSYENLKSKMYLKQFSMINTRLNVYKIL